MRDKGAWVVLRIRKKLFGIRVKLENVRKNILKTYENSQVDLSNQSAPVRKNVSSSKRIEVMEIEAAMQLLKNRRASAMDGIIADMLKCDSKVLVVVLLYLTTGKML